jgi:hypothetical protein
MAPLFLAEIGIPTASQCLAVLAPVAAIFGARWLLHRSDQVVQRLLPSQEWQRQLGWLNIGAERRATTVLRWLGYLVYAALATALYGIAWGAEALRQVGQWSDPMVMGQLTLRLPVLVTCLVVWLIYLGGELLPRLRREYEREELERFRAEQAAAENDHPHAPGSRLTKPPEIWTKSPFSQRPRAGR